MKHFTKILILIFCFLSCSNVEENTNTQLSEKTKEKETPVANQPIRKKEALPAPPPPPKSQTKLEKQLVKEKEQSKIENEITSRKDVIKRMLKEYNDVEKKWINVRSLSEDQFVNLKQQYDLICVKQKLNPSILFDHVYSGAYENSSTQTDKMDGKMFCLHDLIKNESVSSKLLYRRYEGGHYTDAVYIFTMNAASLQTQQLDLYIQYGRDGYGSKIESSFIDSRTIKRKVTEVIGWRERDDKDGSLQPFVETRQIFKLLEDGSIRKTSEEVVKHNFERYLN